MVESGAQCPHGFATNQSMLVTRSVVAISIVTASVFRRRCIDVAGINCGILGTKPSQNFQLSGSQSTQIMQVCFNADDPILGFI
jgi:hypothetical protein